MLAPLIGGGWENPSVPSNPSRSMPAPRPHPQGYMGYMDTHVACPGGCTIETVPVASLRECQALCNSTSQCEAIQIDHGGKNCAVLRGDSPGAADPSCDTWVRVKEPESVKYDWTGTYNSAPPVCPKDPGWECPRYNGSWMPNRTAAGAEIFPCVESGNLGIRIDLSGLHVDVC